MTDTPTDTIAADRHPDLVEFRRSGFAEAYHLVVDGRAVPNITGRRFTGTPEYGVPGEFVAFVVDDRLGYDVPAELADTVARLVADAVAVTLGYSCHPRPTMDTPVPLHPYRQPVLGEPAPLRPYHNGLLDLPDCPPGTDA